MVGLGVAAEQHAVRQDDRRLAGALERLEDVQQEGVVAVLLGRRAELEAAVVVLQPVAPRLDRERRIHDGEVEGRELGALGELRAGDRVALAMSASSLPCRIMFILASAQVALSFSWP